MDTSGIDELSKKYLDFVQSLSGAEKDAAQAQYDRWQKKLDWYKKDLEAAEAAQKSAETGGGLGSFINWFTGDAWTKFVNWTGQYSEKTQKTSTALNDFLQKLRKSMMDNLDGWGQKFEKPKTDAEELAEELAKAAGATDDLGRNLKKLPTIPTLMRPSTENPTEKSATDYLKDLGAPESPDEIFPSYTLSELEGRWKAFWSTFRSTAKSAWEYVKSGVGDTAKILGDLAYQLSGILTGLMDSIESAISDSFYSMLADGQSFKEAMEQMWADIKDAAYRSLSDIGAKLIMSFTKILAFEGGGSTSGKSLPNIPHAQHGLYTGSGEGPVPIIAHRGEWILPDKYIKDFFGTMAQRLLRYQYLAMPHSVALSPASPAGGVLQPPL